MPHQISVSKLTPNLVVADVARSVAFYRDVLGFALGHSVPDVPPYVFASVESGPVEVFLNSMESASAEYPPIGQRAIGGTLTLFLETTGISDVYAALHDRVTVVMPLEKKWYGVTEFAIVDPDGWIITFAERTAV